MRRDETARRFVISMATGDQDSGIRDKTMEKTATGSRTVLRATMYAVAMNNSRHRIASTPVPDQDYKNSRYNGSYTSFTKVNILLSCIHVFLWIISAIALVMMIMFYCCRKNIEKHRQRLSTPQLRVEPEDHNQEVLAMDAMLQQYAERSASQTSHSTCFVTSEPPPTYESIFDPRVMPLPIDKKDESDDLGSIIVPRIGSFPTELETNWINKRENVPKDDQGLPSYEAALKLEADGYV